MVDREQLADFLKTRREALQPEDVGLPRGTRRRTHGLRREEVAALAGMSPDYYSRLEQQRSKQPSEPMLAAIARALHLTLDERDHLFRVSGHNAPHRVPRSDHVNPGLMRILTRQPAVGDWQCTLPSGMIDSLLSRTEACFSPTRSRAARGAPASMVPARVPGGTFRSGAASGQPPAARCELNLHKPSHAAISVIGPLYFPPDSRCTRDG